VSLAGTGPPAAPPEDRSPVGTAAVVATTAMVVRTPAVVDSAGRRAPAGRSVPEGPTAVVPRPATWAPGAGAGSPQAVQARSAQGQSETGPAERRHHRRQHHQTRARHQAGSSTDRRRASTCRERKDMWLDHRISQKESEEVKVRVRGGWCGDGGVGKHGLIKHHMARDEDPTRGDVKAAVALVVRGVPEKHTDGGTGF
jgi:hypothetical protein